MSELDDRLRKLEELKKLREEMNFASEGATWATMQPGQATDLLQSALGGLKEGLTFPLSIGAHVGAGQTTPGYMPDSQGYMQETPEHAELMRSVDTALAGHRPQTAAGRHTKAITANLPLSWIGPGGLALKGAQTVLSAVGAQSFDDFASGEGDASGGGNPYMRMIGAIFGTMIPSYFGRRMPNSTQLLHEATKEMTPLDWKRANMMKRTLDENNIPHLNTQLLGPRSTADDLVGEASTYAGAKPVIETHMEGAIGQSKRALENWTNANQYPLIDSRREFLGDVKTAANQRIKAGERQASAAYTAKMPPPPGGVLSSARINYPPDRIKAMVQELTDIGQSAKFGPTSGGDVVQRFIAAKLTDPVTGELISNRWHLNNIFKNLRTMVKNDPEFKDLPVAEITDTMRKYTPDFQPARDAYSGVMQQTVNPMKKGLVGDLARIGGLERPDRHTATEAAFRIMFSKAAQPAEIRAAAEQLGPHRFSVLFGEHLRRLGEDTLNRSSKIDAPHSFTVALAKNSDQIKNIRAAIEVSAELAGANPVKARDGFYRLMQAFDSFKDAKLSPGINRADIGQKAGFNWFGTIIAPHSRAGRVTWDRVTRQTYREIVDLATSPDGLKKLEEISKLNPASAEMRTVLQALATTAMQGHITASPLLQDIQGK